MHTYTDEDIQLFVKKGAYWFDENHPDWVNKIDLPRLSMFGCRTCIIGQAIGNYRTELPKITGMPCNMSREWAIEHGFEGPEWLGRYASNNYYSTLDLLWTEEVQKRLG